VPEAIPRVAVTALLVLLPQTAQGQACVGVQIYRMDPGVWQLQLAESVPHVPVIQLANAPMQQTSLLAPALPMWTKQHALKMTLVIEACVTMVMYSKISREPPAVEI